MKAEKAEIGWMTAEMAKLHHNLSLTDSPINEVNQKMRINCILELR